MHMNELDKSLRLIAGKSMRHIPLVRDSLLWVKEHPSNFKSRVDKFNIATRDVSDAVVLGGANINGKRGLGALKQAYRQADSGVPLLLSDLVGTYVDAPKFKWEGWQDYVQGLDNSVTAIGENLINGSLKFHPEVFAHPPTFLTRLMVEGYALELSRFYKQPKLIDTYKQALGEVLSGKEYSRTILAEDFSYWFLLEKENPSSLVTLKDYSANKDNEKKTPLTDTAKKINEHFREGEDAEGVIDQIRLFPRPIAVDFNNVIANNGDPLQLNPDAPQFLEDLHGIGNIFILTHAVSWPHVQRFFVTHNIWKPDMVLMTYPTYEFLNYSSESSRAGQLRLEFNQLAQQHFGNEFSEDDLMNAGFKRVAPIFNKPWEIPIIDDSSFSTENNPGMLGIQVKAWEPTSSNKLISKNNEGLPTLAEAAKIVRDHYSKISSDNYEGQK